MDRYALLVDAGYFFAAGAEACFDPVPSRREIRLANPAQAIAGLKQRSAALCDNIQLLRVYWYDAMPGPTPSVEQNELALQNGVKLRLGVLNSYGQQKGVDSLLVTDLIELARNGAIADAVVLSGDEDLRVGVQVAQSYGLRVHLLGAGDIKRNTSRTLRMEADSFSVIDTEWFRANLEHFVADDVEPAVAAQSFAPVDVIEGEALNEAAERVSRSLLGSLDLRALQQLKNHFEVSKLVPLEYDPRLIGMTSSAMKDDNFTKDELRTIRGVFVTTVRTMYQELKAESAG